MVALGLLSHAVDMYLLPMYLSWACIEMLLKCTFLLSTSRQWKGDMVDIGRETSPAKLHYEHTVLSTTVNQNKRKGCIIKASEQLSPLSRHKDLANQCQKKLRHSLVPLAVIIG